MSSFDLARARRDTPACEQILHFNNAGASLLPAPVVEAVAAYGQREAHIGGYEAEAEAEPQLERVYTALAELLHCAPDEISWHDGATRAWDMAFYAIPFQPGDRILTAHAEYASNYIAMLQVARKTGAVIETIPDDEYGQVDVEALSRMLDAQVKLIALTHVPTNGGLVNPAAAVGKVARDAGILYLLDACQSVGQMPIDVQEIGCDILSATGRKYLRGPRGTGFLYTRRAVMETLEPPFLDMQAATWTAPDRYEIRPDARRFETFETNLAGKVGFGVAVDYALQWGLEAIQARVTQVAERLRAELAALPGVTVRDLGQTRGGIVTFTVDGMEASDVPPRLALQRINVRVSPRIATRLDMDRRDLEGVVRASVHYYNSEEEVTRFCTAVRALV